MGWQLTKAVWDSDLPGALKPMAAAIARTILDQDKGERPGLTVFAQLKTLARIRGTHLTAARKQVQGLVRVGVLEIVRPGGGRRAFGAGRKRRVAGVSTVYRFRPDKLPLYASEIARESEYQLASETSSESSASRLEIAIESSPNPSEIASESSRNPTDFARALRRNTDLTRKTDLGRNEERTVTDPLRSRADAYPASHGLDHIFDEFEFETEEQEP